MMVKTAQRLAVLVSVLILVGGTGFFTQRFQINRLAQRELGKAELAFKEGDFARAETLFREHLQVFPQHQEIQIKYADTLLKSSRSLAAQSEAAGIYSAILKRSMGMGREDVRKKLIKLKFDLGRLVSSPGREDGADVDLGILLATEANRNDPHLLYLLGRCDEARGDDATAAKSAAEIYRKVVGQKDAPDRIDAGERLAKLLRDKLKEPKEAQAVVNKLVEVDPKDYRGYLVRGRFRLDLAARDQTQKSLESDANKDFEKARELARYEPDVYLQQAQSAMSTEKSGYDRARQILRDGLKHAPTAKAIYETLVELELRAGHLNEAIDVLELGVQGIELRMMLTLKNAGEIPAKGKNLIVVAAVNNILHFRIFDAEGKVTKDTDETELKVTTDTDETNLKATTDTDPTKLKATTNTDPTKLKVTTDTDETKSKKRAQQAEAERAQQVEALRKRLKSLSTLRAAELTKSDKDSIIAAVASIVDDKVCTGLSDESNLRLRLTDLLARRGDTGKLLLQIEELKKLGYSQLLIQYFTACYYINSHDFLKARPILVTLQAALSRVLDVKFKSRINVLLAQCYGELGEPEMQQNALVGALGADPQDLTARLAWINNLLSQGDTAGAIKEYRAVVNRLPQVRPMLVRLLIAQNQRRPEPQRDWKEANELINQMDEAGPEATQRAVLRAELLYAQGDRAGARDELDKAKARFPKSVEIRIAQASLAGFEDRVEEAFSLIDQAKEQLGDHVDLRLKCAQLWALKKGPQVLKALMDLSQNVETFSKVDQKRLLHGLALELARQQDLEGASQVWARLAADDPANIGLRLNLLDLALQTANKADIEKNIKQIEEIEGNEGVQGRYCQVRYLIWQAQRAGDKDTRQAIQDKARGLLEDLVSRRGDWSVIPLASAELAEQELALNDLKGDELRAKEESIINFYIQAIKLGQRRAAVVRRTVQLLFKNKQGDRALELLSNIPMESQLASEERQAARFAIENRDFPHALQIARKAVQANPGDFQERIWLVTILLTSDQQAEAAKELREAVNLAPSDPDRWVFLVNFMILTKQISEAEKAIKEAETKLPPSKLPLTMALCCEKMGRAYDAGTDNADMKRWNDAARSWYEKAQAAEPADLSIKRRFIDFFLRSRQTNEAQNYLEALIKQGGGAKNPEITAWANRALALVLASGTDRTQLSKALAIFEPDGKPVPAGQEGKMLERKNLGDPEDLRVLARVLDLQRTVVHRKRAIEILETLADKNQATSEDRFTVARLYEAIGQWQKAQEKYRELNLRTRNLRDMETLNRRPLYIAQFASNILQHCKAGDNPELAEAQELVDELKLLQPAALGTLVLQVEIYRVRNEIDRAAESIQAFASNPSLAPEVLAALAELAEKIKLAPLAEQLYRRLVDIPGSIGGKLRYASYLARQDKITAALKICEPLWNTQATDDVAATCIDILFGPGASNRAPDPADLERVGNWFEKAIAQARTGSCHVNGCSHAWETCASGKTSFQTQSSYISRLFNKVIAPESRSTTSPGYWQ